MANHFVFSASGASGRELWISDGTAAGTRLLADINPGPGSSYPENFFASGNSTVGFVAAPTGDAISGRTNWVTDGTSSGTRQLLGPSSNAVLGSLGTRTLFAHPNQDGSGNDTLYITDNTDVGTSLGITFPDTYRPSSFVDLGHGKTIFVYGPQYSQKLWMTDGTAAGTVVLSDDRNDIGAVSLGDGRALVTTSSFTNGSPRSGKLLVTDGTSAGTSVLLDDQVSSPSVDLVLGNGRALVAVPEQVNGSAVDRLWVTDGTLAGTQPLNHARNASALLISGGRALFSDPSGDGLLSVTDGTLAGTYTLGPAAQGFAASWQAGGKYLYSVTTQNATDVWATDGTPAGTSRLAVVGSTETLQFNALGDGRSVFFSYDGTASHLWLTDGTATGTRQLAGVLDLQGPTYSDPSHIETVAQLSSGEWVFQVYYHSQAAIQRLLVATDLTVGGTHVLPALAPYYLTAVGDGRATFQAYDTGHGSEIWITDGTDAGTHILKDILPGGTGSNAADFFVLESSGTATIGIDPVAGDDVINRAELLAGFSLSGQTDAGDGRPVTVTIQNATNATLATFSASVHGNAWSVAVPTTVSAGLVDGTIHVTASVTTASGVHVVPDIHDIIVDQTSPVATLRGETITAFGDHDSVKMTFTLDETLPGTGIHVYDGGIDLGAATINGSGLFTFAADLASGAHALRAIASDAAGNTRSVALASVQDDSVGLGFAFLHSGVLEYPDKVIITGPSGVSATLIGIHHYQFTDGTIDQHAGSALVDDLYYFANNRDVYAAHVDATAHYMQSGWHEGRDPSASFSTNGYLAANPDVAAAGIDPLQHYDLYGWREGRDPSANFDSGRYLAVNPDVAGTGSDPLAHYLVYGQSEGRGGSVAVGRPEDVTHGSFDAAYYLLSNPDVAKSALSAGGDTQAFAYQHYEAYGWHEGRDPNAFFDVKGYLNAYADVKAAGIDPLGHYDTFGWMDGRDPSRGFDTARYLAAYPDVAQAHVDPLTHFLIYGYHEGRSPYGDGTFFQV